MKHLLNQTALILLGVASCFFLFSCGATPKTEVIQKPVEAKVKGVKKVETLLVNPEEKAEILEGRTRWLTLKGDTELPTTQQLTEGRRDFADVKSSDFKNDKAPSASMKPPSPEEEADQLAPEE